METEITPEKLFEAMKIALPDLVAKISALRVSDEVTLGDIHALRGTLDYVVVDKEGMAYEVGQEEGGVWTNVSQHCAMAFIVADVIAEKMGLDAGKRSVLRVAAYLHDSGKKTERQWQLTLEEELGVESGAQAGVSGAPPSDNDALSWNKQLALTHVVEMEQSEHLDAGIPLFVSTLMRANVPSSQLRHEHLVEKIIWFADACLSGIKIVPIDTRFNDLERDAKNGQRNIAFSDSYRTHYGGKSLYEVQRHLGEQYTVEFANMLGMEPANFITWLQTIAYQRVISKNISL